MKRYAIFCLLISCFFIVSSCSEDGGSTVATPKSSVSAKINGVDTVFDTVTIYESTYDDGGVTHTDLFITAYMDDIHDSREMQFNFDKGVVGTNDIFFFLYEIEDVIYDYEDTQPETDTAAISSQITLNSDTKAQGTFSGTLTYYNTTTMLYESVEVTEGSFTLYH